MVEALFASASFQFPLIRLQEKADYGTSYLRILPSFCYFTSYQIFWEFETGLE